MTDRDGIFAGDDPLHLMRSWMAEAEKTEVNDPNAMSLATVGESGLPNVRVVLLKQIDDRGLIFYTNYRSVKSVELEQSAVAAVVLHWKSLRRQIRVRGAIEKVESALADAYYDSRSLNSRLGAWASDQSQTLTDRSELISRFEQVKSEHGDAPARPPHWGGFRIVPTEIEFWADGAHRLHDRFRWTRPDAKQTWDIARLFP